mgnify:CR=1 FL=1
MNPDDYLPRGTLKDIKSEAERRAEAEAAREARDKIKGEQLGNAAGRTWTPEALSE